MLLACDHLFHHPTWTQWAEIVAKKREEYEADRKRQIEESRKREADDRLRQSLLDAQRLKDEIVAEYQSKYGKV